MRFILFKFRKSHEVITGKLTDEAVRSTLGSLRARANGRMKYSCQDFRLI